jgi:dihydropteroate synthase
MQKTMNKLLDDHQKFLLKCGEKILDLSSRTHVMGILNITPDSFSDGGEFFTVDQAVKRGIQMADEGADIIDIGAESTRPGAEPISTDEELKRLLPVLEQLLKKTGVPISVDTYKSKVAEAALSAGAHIINDISGLRFDPSMKDVIARFQVPVIIMHIKGEPRNMQIDPHYEDLISEISAYLAESIRSAEMAGVKKENMIIDPGIGFGKRLEDNYEIIRRLHELKRLGCSILIGPSRKSFLGKVLNLPPAERLEGTMAAVAVAIQNGADIIRVHDVKAVSRVCRIADVFARKSPLIA